VTFKPEDMKAIEAAAAAFLEHQRKEMDALRPMIEQVNRAMEEDARKLEPVVAAFRKDEEERARAMAPLLAQFNKIQEETAAAFAPYAKNLEAAMDLPRTAYIAPPARDWETPAAAAVEKIKTEAGGPEPAKAELAFELARGVADAAERLIASNTVNRVALETAIYRLVRSSDGNTSTMSRLTGWYVALTFVIAAATIASVVIAWRSSGPAHVDVHVPAPIVNVQTPASSLPPPTSERPVTSRDRSPTR
jgi:hypothetical protein